MRSSPHQPTGQMEKPDADHPRRSRAQPRRHRLGWGGAVILIDPDKIKLAAAAIANARGGRRGMPPVKNILELLPQKLVDEVTEDAEATLHAVGDHLTIHVLKTRRDELLAALEKAANALEEIAELTWDKRNPDATRNACDEASSLANTECEEARAIIAKAEGRAP